MKECCSRTRTATAKDVERLLDNEIKHQKRKPQGYSVKFAIIEVERIKQLLKRKFSEEAK